MKVFTNEKETKYADALPLLKALIEKAQSAISAIENNRPGWEISQLAIEDIDVLTEQISSAIYGDCSSIINTNLNIKK